jgi:membrane fusion protein, multidrug efflux system
MKDRGMLNFSWVGPADHGGTSPSRARRVRWSLRRLLIATAGSLLVVVAGVYAEYWWTEGRFLISTDDAYVDAHSTLIAPKVSGYVAAVLVDDNETVRAGQILARIDSRDYQAGLDQARGNVAAAQANIDTLSQQIAQQKLIVEQAQEQVVADQAALAYSEQNYRRYTSLARLGISSVQQAQQSTADIREKRAILRRDTTAVAVAEGQISVLGGQLAQANAVLAMQRAVEAQATLNLGYTVIRAPVDGTVGVRTVTRGQYVQPGTQLMAVVPLHRLYVTANYKETELTHVRPGEPVTIAVDTFPGVTVHGRVESVAPASGEQFALLPPDNATGNFTKIVQRIPVKIVVDKGDPLAGMLRPGMSVEPTINTKAFAIASGAATRS